MKDTQVTICDSGSLAIKETCISYTSHSRKDGFDEVNKDTKRYFHWKIHTFISKTSVADLNDDNKKDQEMYQVDFTSNGYDLGYTGFKTREKAIQNAVEFAKRNGIELDGYE